MVKRLLLLTIILFFFQITVGFSQITIGTVDPGPYTPGSSIAATFTLGPDCIAKNNSFNLFLVSPGGVETNIGSYVGFYSTFVNGNIPITTPALSGYKLRIKSTNPVYTSDSNPFEIKAGTPVTAKVSSNPINTANPETFGYCTNRTNSSIFITNLSTASGTTTATVTNSLDGGAPTIINFDAQIKTFVPGAAHYTMFVKVQMPDGSIATKAYFIINNLANTAFSTSGSGLVCLPLGELVYGVDFITTGGIQRNFPGNLYKITWGDNSEDFYTLCELMQNGNIKHNYMRSSCGSTFDGRRNVFGIDISAQSPFCGQIGQPLSTYAKVVTVAENKFRGPLTACVNNLATYINESLPGQNPDENSTECTDNNITYNWYVNGQIVLPNVPKTTNFNYTFLTAGDYEIKLESVSSGACQGAVFTKMICVQNQPKPDFIFSGNTTPHCAPFAIVAIDKSIVDDRCGTSHQYNWIVRKSGRPALASEVNFTNGIKEPTFTFLKQGTYEIALQITSPPCGAVTTTPPQTVVIIDSAPTIALTPTANLCRLDTYQYNSSTTGPTNVQFSGTEVDAPDTYTWSVTASDGTLLTNADYSFENGSTTNSKEPFIQFKQYRTYKVTVTHKNSCGTITKEQLISFFESPVPTIVATPSTICYNDVVNLQGDITNRTPSTTFVWSGAPGGVFSNPGILTTTYTPTLAERNAGTSRIRLTVNTGLTGACAQVFVDLNITILPNNVSTNPIATRTQNICSGNAAVFNPTTATAGTTFTWTVQNADGNATLPSTSGSGNINQVLVNNSQTQNAVVVYTITPATLQCTGVPFTFTATVYPKPAVSATAAKATICSGEEAGIALTPSMPGLQYTWTSSATNGVTGNSNRTVATNIPSINDALTNIGIAQGTVTYIITPKSITGGCAGDPFTITINVDPAVTTATAGTNFSICDALIYKLNGNTPKQNETGTWTLTSGQTGVTFTDTDLHSPDAVANGLVAGQVYTFRWTITAPGVCNPSFADVTITVNPPTIAGTIDGTRTVCSGNNNGTINLTGNLGNVIRWEQSTNGGTSWQPVTNTSTTLNYSGLTTNTQYHAIVKNGSCDEKITNTITITVNPADTQADAGIDEILCNETSVTLQANANNPLKPGESGLWTLVPANPNVDIKTPVNSTTLVEGLVAGQVYTFRWTVTGPSACGPTADDVTITNNPPIDLNTVTSSSTVCNGQQVTVIGSAPIGGAGAPYTYAWETNIGGGTWTIIPGEIGKDLSITLTNTGQIGFRRIVTSGGCTSTSNAFIITVQPPIGGNTIAADQILCSGVIPGLITGNGTLTGGDGDFRYQWQSSTDGTNWADITGAQQPDYQPLALTATTYYRRQVNTAACSGAFQNHSNTVKITVKPNAKAEYTWISDTGCAPFALQITAVSYSDRNASYTWFADGVQIGTGITFPAYSIQNSNVRVRIRLLVTSSQGCTDDEMTHDFSTNQAVPASFTPVTTVDCGPKMITFVNTAIQTAGATFKWNFGNGQNSNASNPPAITFQPDPSAKDTTYTVTLYSITSCGIDSTKGTVLVKSPPRPVFSPSTTNGCSPLPVIFSNNSPLQTGTTYVFNFGDGTPPQPMTDRSDVNHIYRTTTNTQSFIATMTATNECGTVTSVPYTIVVKPNTVRANLVVNGDQLRGCAPFTATFDNNSTGATSYTVDFKDGTPPRPSFSAPERFQHIFTLPGSYEVTLTATNGCSTNSTSVTITVLPQPLPSFIADNTLGCPGMSVQFRNTTPDAQFTSFEWDFGDGSPKSTDVEPPPHIYNGNQEYYTVRLTATNALGCPNTVVMNQYIHIVQPPVAAFNVNPSTLISIPDYTFQFEDKSTNTPTIWQWDFGDGMTSGLKNPSHTYLDTGTYKVTLKVLNQQGCFTTTFKNVTIKGVPGYLFVPNSFIPGDTKPELREFSAKGSGILNWRFSIFNKWGQLLWESTKLEEGRPAEGWDGTFKGQPMPQGVYYWKIDVQMVNGSEWKGMTYDKSAPKRTGAIHLIR